VDSIRIQLWRVTAAHTRPGYTTGAFSLGANGFYIKGGYKLLAYQVIGDNCLLRETLYNALSED